MNKRICRKKNKRINHTLFQDLILKYLVPSGFHIDEQCWLSGYLINTINTDSIVRFTLKELPQIYFGAFIDKESKTISICATHEIYYDKLKPSYCEFNQQISSPTDTLKFIDDLKEIKHKPWLVDDLTEDEFSKDLTKHLSDIETQKDDEKVLIRTLKQFVSQSPHIYAAVLEKDTHFSNFDFTLTAYVDPTINLDQELYDKIEKGFISIFLDENLLEKAYLNDPDLIGLVNPVLHTKLKSLSSLNHTQRITYINELYDEHWSDKHTTVIY